MTESFEAYQARIISYTNGREPIALQEQMPDVLKRLLEGLTWEQLSWQPAPAKWSIQQIVAHLADDELVGAYRIRLILSAPGTAIQAFDQAKWAVQGQYEKVPVADSLTLFTRLREANLQLFRLLEPEQWDYFGIHAERGKERIRDIALYYAGHDINHLQQIQAILDKQAIR